MKLIKLMKLIKSITKINYDKIIKIFFALKF